MNVSYFPVFRHPEPDESLIGFATRLSLLHGYSSLQQFMSVLGLTVRPETFYRSDGQARVLRAIKAMIPPVEITAFDPQQFSPTIEEYFRLKGYRLCPQCNIEGKPHLQSFQNTYNTVCEKHSCFVLNECQHCHAPITSVNEANCQWCFKQHMVEDANYTPHHFKLITTLNKTTEKFELHLFRWCQFISRPYDLMDAAITTRYATIKECHEAFEFVSALLFDQRARQSYFNTIWQELPELCCLGAGELECRTSRTMGIQNSINKRIENNIDTKRQLTHIEGMQRLKPFLRHDHYERRGINTLDSDGYKLANKITLTTALGLEHSTVHYLTENRVLPAIKSDLVSQHCFDLKKVGQEIRQHLPSVEKPTFEHICISEINTHVLGKYFMTFAELLAAITLGKLHAVKTKLCPQTQFLKTIHVRNQDLQNYCASRLLNNKNKVSIVGFANILSVNAWDLRHEHEARPFDDLNFSKNWLDSHSIQHFFDNYISIARIEYLTKLDPFELIDYFDSFPSEKRILASTSHKAVIYKRSKNIDAVINDLKKQGRLQTKFKIPPTKFTLTQK
jgi:hypothetical protein